MRRPVRRFVWSMLPFCEGRVAGRRRWLPVIAPHDRRSRTACSSPRPHSQMAFRSFPLTLHFPPTRCREMCPTSWCVKKLRDPHHFTAGFPKPFILALTCKLTEVYACQSEKTRPEKIFHNTMANNSLYGTGHKTRSVNYWICEAGRFRSGRRHDSVASTGFSNITKSSHPICSVDRVEGYRTMTPVCARVGVSSSRWNVVDRAVAPRF